MAFPKEVVSRLETNYYQQGLTGWGKKYADDLKAAAKSSGLTVKQEFFFCAGKYINRIMVLLRMGGWGTYA